MMGSVEPTSLVIADARSDPAFVWRTEQLQTRIGSYIGVTIVRGDGRLCGTLCALDPEPHALTAAQVELLMVLARLLATSLERDEELAERVVEHHRAAADRHTLRLELPPPGSVIGHWDAARLEQVLGNLLANAIKYSPNGGTIAVAVTREPTATGAQAMLTVADQGVGIPTADLPHIFERFRRGSNVAQHAPGLGIGLASAHQIVTQHGGTITIATQEGCGTTVTLRLPLQPPQAPASAC